MPNNFTIYKQPLAAGEGHICIQPLAYSAIIQGTWIPSLDASQYLYSYITNSSTADNLALITFSLINGCNTHCLNILAPIEVFVLSKTQSKLPLKCLSLMV